MISRRALAVIAVMALTITAVSCAALKNWKEAHTPPDDACIHCHYGIYKDWKISYRPYNEAVKKDDYIQVHSRPMSGADVEMQQAHDNGKGECSRCHIVSEPRELMTITGPATSSKETVYRLCGRCHEKTFQEWKGSSFSKDESSCMICHTGINGDAIASGEAYYHTEEGVEGYDIIDMRSKLMVDRLKEAISINSDISLNGRDINVLLLVANKGVGHDLPADEIKAVLVIKLTLFDSKGDDIERKAYFVGGQGRKPIPPGKEIYLDYKLEAPSKGEYLLETSLIYADIKRAMDDDLFIFKEKEKIVIE